MSEDRIAKFLAEWTKFRHTCDEICELHPGSERHAVLRASDIASLQSKLDRAVEVMERSREGWENAIEMGLIPHQHCNAARILADEARTTLSFIKDGQ